MAHVGGYFVSGPGQEISSEGIRLKLRVGRPAAGRLTCGLEFLILWLGGGKDLGGSWVTRATTAKAAEFAK